MTLSAPARSLLLTTTPTTSTHPGVTASFTVTALDDSPYAGIGGLGR